MPAHRRQPQGAVRRGDEVRAGGKQADVRGRVRPAEPVAAVCTDCHRPHEIARVDASDFRLGVVDECAGCHAFESETYRETFHGKASTLGGGRAAKCQDCHGAHGILSLTDGTLTENAYELRLVTFAPCVGDVNDDGEVNFTDLLHVINDWGPVGCGTGECP